MCTLLTLNHEVQGSNPGAAQPKFGAQTPPYPPPPGRKDASRVPERDGVRESWAPGMTKKMWDIAVFFKKKSIITFETGFFTFKNVFLWEMLKFALTIFPPPQTPSAACSASLTPVTPPTGRIRTRAQRGRSSNWIQSIWGKTAVVFGHFIIFQVLLPRLWLPRVPPPGWRTGRSLCLRARPVRPGGLRAHPDTKVLKFVHPLIPQILISILWYEKIRLWLFELLGSPHLQRNKCVKKDAICSCGINYFCCRKLQWVRVGAYQKKILVFVPEPEGFRIRAEIFFFSKPNTIDTRTWSFFFLLIRWYKLSLCLTWYHMKVFFLNISVGMIL